MRDGSLAHCSRTNLPCIVMKHMTLLSLVRYAGPCSLKVTEVYFGNTKDPEELATVPEGGWLLLYEATASLKEEPELEILYHAL
jgi:hypothetical protein